MNEEPPNGIPDCILMPFRCHTPEGQDGSLKIGYWELTQFLVVPILLPVKQLYQVGKS
jgi:hypothetical protein